MQQRLWSAMAAEVLTPVTLGLAHDLNNQLTGILSVSDLCLHKTRLDRPSREQLEIIRASGERAAALVRILFVEHQATLGRSELHDLNTLTRAYLDLAQRAISKSIDVNLILAPEPLPVMVDAVAFRTALLYVAFNAAAGIQNRGQLEVRTSSQAKVPNTANFKAREATQQWAACAVSAIRPGIDPKRDKSLDSTAKDAPGDGGFDFTERLHRATPIRLYERRFSAFSAGRNNAVC